MNDEATTPRQILVSRLIIIADCIIEFAINYPNIEDGGRQGVPLAITRYTIRGCEGPICGRQSGEGVEEVHR
ncbi:unnamed protein product [Leptidea sinapis]|uniref:Uncharacterized protein n=1 Tax=Leptidea sinapis TaxID=189913 RepID=A0A5E4Q0Z0_9NEOP|nr:unnamed protein product [Leptidea sinapis]